MKKKTEIQNRGTSGPQKGHVRPPKTLKKMKKLYRILSKACFEK